MRGGRRLPAVAPHPGEDGGLRVCIDIPGLNRVASLERLWPSRVGRSREATRLSPGMSMRMRSPPS